MRRSLVAIALVVASVTFALPALGPAPSGAAPRVLFGRVHETFQPNRGKIFVLVIGNDARSGNPVRSRADAIHIVGINTKTMRGAILNFPRDSWVEIPGHGHAKINEAVMRGGPQTLARTLEKLTRIRIDYWVMTGFEGVQGFVKAIRGVRMHLARDIYDQGGSGARLRKGTQILNGAEALAFVRTRKAFSRGDITRTTNHGRFLVALLRKLRRDVRRDPATVLEWIALTRKHARFDVSPGEMFELGVLASQLDPRRVGNTTVPVSLGFMGAQSVVFISSRARAIYRRFGRTAAL